MWKAGAFWGGGWSWLWKHFVNVSITHNSHFRHSRLQGWTLLECQPPFAPVCLCKERGWAGLKCRRSVLEGITAKRECCWCTTRGRVSRQPHSWCVYARSHLAISRLAFYPLDLWALAGRWTCLAAGLEERNYPKYPCSNTWCTRGMLAQALIAAYPAPSRETIPTTKRLSTCHFSLYANRSYFHGDSLVNTGQYSPSSGANPGMKENAERGNVDMHSSGASILYTPQKLWWCPK